MTRQRYGTGSMKERAPNTWRLRAYDRETKRQVAHTFKGNRTAAAKELSKLVTEVEAGRTVRTAATLGELLDEWIRRLEAGGDHRPSTLLGYRRKIEHDIRPALGKARLSRLGPAQLDRFYGEQLGRGMSSATVRQMHAVISAACHQAVKWGWLPSNPAERATPPAVRNPKMAIPEFDQINTLYRAARDYDPVLGMAVALAALTGARRGELCALRWSDVGGGLRKDEHGKPFPDLTVGRITIARSLTVVDGKAIEGDTKTHQVRTIALDDVGVAVLRDRWEFMVDLSKRADSPLVADPFVLSYQAHGGTPAGPDTISHRFATVAKATGIDCHLHSLRHFSVTTLIAAGMDIRTVAERHGHAQATMTLNRYAHALPERDRVAAGVLGKAISAS
jgi:integrase